MTQITQKTVRCPFDPSHILSYERFLTHVDKCKFPDKLSYKKCRFNPYHIIHKKSIQSHQANCPDRKKYNPISDDEDQWWGVEEQEEKEEPEKSILQTQITDQPTQPTSPEDSPKPQEVKNKGKQKEYVVVQDFDSADFSDKV